MASHCRSCKLPVPSTRAEMPSSELLEPLTPFVGTLMDCAAEFDSFDPDATTAVEFVRWLSVDLRRLEQRP